MVWARGDAWGLRVIETPVGRVGGLICWENYMPLARFAVFAQGCDIYVAPTWDHGERWLATMRHIAAEGRCWVIGTGSAMRGKDIPKDFPQRAKLFPNLEECYNAGDSVAVNPSGVVVAGPRPAADGVLRPGRGPARSAPAARAPQLPGPHRRAAIF